MRRSLDWRQRLISVDRIARFNTRVITMTQQLMPPPPTECFRYFNGLDHVFADPWPIHRAILRETGGNPNLLRMKIHACKPDSDNVELIMEACEASEQLEALSRKIFKMKDFNPQTGQGAQWPVCLAVWDQFATYLIELKKKSRDHAGDFFA